MPWYSSPRQLDLLLVQRRRVRAGAELHVVHVEAGVDDRQRHTRPGWLRPARPIRRGAKPMGGAASGSVPGRCELRATGRSGSANRRAPVAGAAGISRCAPLGRRQMQVGCDDRGAVCRQQPLGAARRRGRRASCGRSHRAPRPRGRSAPGQPGPPAPGLAQLRRATPARPQDGALADTIATDAACLSWAGESWATARRRSDSPSPA